MHPGRGVLGPSGCQLPRMPCHVRLVPQAVVALCAPRTLVPAPLNQLAGVLHSPHPPTRPPRAQATTAWTTRRARRCWTLSCTSAWGAGVACSASAMQASLSAPLPVPMSVCQQARWCLQAVSQGQPGASCPVLAPLSTCPMCNNTPLQAVLLPLRRLRTHVWRATWL